jgi:bifunctional non-homologous end joining protein LigD
MPLSLDDRRLAMATEDHPLDYLDFEGIIPAGQYGAGTVMVWDIGTYDVVEGSYYSGSLHLHLLGEKLRGEWRLVRDRGDTDRRRWTLTKAGAAMRALPAARAGRSARSGRTMAEITAANDARWHSNRPVAGTAPEVDLAALPRTPAGFMAPMLAKLTTALPEGEDWQYEVKLDGYRALAVKRGGTVQLLSRNGNVLAGRFPAVAAALATLDDDTVLDGEVVAVDAQGRPSFALLQSADGASPTVVYYVFDVPVLRGRDLRRVPLTERRALLEDVVARLPEPIRLSQVFDAGAEEMVAAARAQGLEGVVAKRRSSVYEPGQRSGAWAKVRVHQGQELVVGGYVPGARHLDALLVGYHDEQGLKFVGKIRNGFVPETRRKLFEQLQALRTDTCPFVNLPEPRGARRGKALTAEEMKACQWVEPRLVVQVAFTDWTAADHLRHARFVGVRDDKDARGVVRERAVPAPGEAALRPRGKRRARRA